MTASAAELVAALLDWPPVPCSLCGDAVHRVKDPVLDEFTWVDDRGSSAAADMDLRHLQPDPYAHLSWLGTEMDRLSKQAKRPKGGGYAWPNAQVEAEYHARGREYSSLKVRLDMKGSLHQHQVFKTGHLQPWPYGPVPDHCGWPMRLAPSGWVCRQCGDHRS